MTTTLITHAWEKIAPCWPLKNIIAVNPLQGFETMPFDAAMNQGAAYFEQSNFPLEMKRINAESIKWFQAFFDEGQATITMPYREGGLYQSWRELARFDGQLHQNNSVNKNFLKNLSMCSESIIETCLVNLQIQPEEKEQFLTLLLTSLPGWASFAKYKADWETNDNRLSTLKTDYLAVRIIITYLLWPNARKLLAWHETIKTEKISQDRITAMQELELHYQQDLLGKLQQSMEDRKEKKPKIQFAFCIDVRSEPVRSQIEKNGRHETFGVAGFFCIPVSIKNTISCESYDSCPVLLKSNHTIVESFHARHIRIVQGVKKLYQALKYTFTTSFALVETLGFLSGISMLFRTIFPTKTTALKNKFLNFSDTESPSTLSIDDSVGIDAQCLYAKNLLAMMGLTENFSEIVVLCGHKSSTENNAYGSSLDCGACGGRSGDKNARIMATILNKPYVREYLTKEGIVIPDTTIFVAALHDTTINKLTLCENANHYIQHSFDEATRNLPAQNSVSKSADWAETRPEWGLARNASFIVAPRALTKDANLEGRSFLNSYDWEKDGDGSILESILLGPMVVGQWINSQYLFSLLNTVAYGSGSKITHNITGKIGIMQGNASDLMTGLPVQSLLLTDKDEHHQALRLSSIIMAPRNRVVTIIKSHLKLENLVSNAWTHLFCIDPENKQNYRLMRDLRWEKLN
ncbi:MAG: DUF2309 domain-containing protein [Gammaproteobacteria bacterium]|nr:DUF2309 domain-containing protein [Gammaproteobacteria bacterium]